MQLKKTFLPITIALFASLTVPVQADSDAMMALLKVLRDRGTISDQDYQMLVRAAREEKMTASASAEKLDQAVKIGQETEAKVAAVAKTVEEAPTVSLKGGHLKIKSADGNFSTQIGGSVMMDAATFSADLGSETGSEVRRARLYAKGTIYSDWDYKAQLGFAG